MSRDHLKTIAPLISVANLKQFNENQKNNNQAGSNPVHHRTGKVKKKTGQWFENIAR